MARTSMAACLFVVMPLTTVSCAGSDPQASSAPRSAVAATPIAASTAAAELTAFVPDPAGIRLERRGDLDGDGDDDVLLVLVAQAGPDARFDPRTLLVLLRGADGKLAKAVDNPKAIPCEHCGGMMGDPLQDIMIDKGGFTLRLEGGSRELWTQAFRFDYSRKDAMWMLASIDEEGADRGTGTTSRKRESPEKFGQVRLDDFMAEEYPANVMP